MLLKELLYHGRVKNKYKDKIRKYSINYDKAFLNSFKDCFGGKKSKFIFENAQTGNWQVLEKSVNCLRFSLLLRGFFNCFHQIKNWCNYFHGQFRRYFINQHGIFLVLIGPDGSGKSITANNLMKSEIKKFFQKEYYFHGHFAFLPELKKIVSLVNKKKEASRLTVSSSTNDLKPFGILRSLIYPIYYGVNYLLGHFFIWKEKARGNLIIFDRYFYDYLIQPCCLYCPRGLLYVIMKVIPTPDVIIYLENKAETIHRRKPELTLDEIRRQKRECAQLIRKFNNSFRIKTFTVEETKRNIQKIIVDNLIKKVREK